MTRIVFNSITKADLFKHLHIVVCSGFKSLCLKKLILPPKNFYSLAKLFLYCDKPLVYLLFSGYKMLPGIYGYPRQVLLCISRKRIDNAYLLDIVIKKLYPYSILFVRRKYLYSVASNSKFSTRKINVISLIMNINQRFKHILTRNLCTGFQK